MAAVLVALSLPAVAVAHAELETATPADGAVLDAPPTEIVLTYTEELDTSRSSLTLHDAGGAEVASGGVDPDNGLSMRIDPPALEPGAYEIRSTAVAAHDGAIDREVLTFTITAPTPSPTAESTATPAAPPSPSAEPVASASPAPRPSAGDETASGTADVLLPILAALALVALLGGWLLRNRSRSRA